MEAIADYSKAIRINPEGFLAYYNRGNAKIDAQDYEGAIKDFTEVIEITVFK